LIRNKRPPGSTGARWHDLSAVARHRQRPHDHSVSHGPSELRAKGRRLTRQRQLIWDTFAAQPERHLSAEDVVERVRDQLPQMNASTVYRTLDLLVSEGLLLRTDLGTDRAFFEPAREHAHHHLVCEQCGAVAHFHDELLGNLPARIKASSGYALADSEITLFGLCPSCQERSATS
jgi:Fur family ferric uptake transcriptional regulator